MKERNETVQVQILGARGSVSVAGKHYDVFGGATSAYRILAGGEELFLDAGTGLRNLRRGEVETEHIRLFLTHCHIDHILGLPFFALDHCGGRQVDIYGRTRSGEPVERQLEHFISPPLWPVKLSEYRGARLTYHEAEGTMEAGPFTVTCTESRHPGGALAYRVDVQGHSIVLATDFEHGEGAEDRLAEFAKDADLLIYDGQYTEEEYREYRGFGHSTPQAGLEVQRRSGAKLLRIVHHAPEHTDEMLAAMEAALGSPAAGFAREGEEILL